MRGIMTQDMIQIPAAPDSAEVYIDGTPNLTAAHLTVYTDGSGGPDSSTPLLRRCGYAWCTLNDEELSYTYVRFAGLPGVCQTVPRAEAQTVADALTALDIETGLEFEVGNQPVVNTCNAISGFC